MSSNFVFHGGLTTVVAVHNMVVMSCHLRMIRVDRGLTQVELASKAGVTRQYIRNLEIGESMPSLDVARRIAEALGTDVNEIWPRQDESAA